jgi:hypothetical protein
MYENNPIVQAIVLHAYPDHITKETIIQLTDPSFAWFRYKDELLINGKTRTVISQDSDNIGCITIHDFNSEDFKKGDTITLLGTKDSPIYYQNK